MDWVCLYIDACWILIFPVVTLTASYYTILPKVLGHPLLMKGLTTLVISMSTNFNV